MSDLYFFVCSVIMASGMLFLMGLGAVIAGQETPFRPRRNDFIIIGIIIMIVAIMTLCSVLFMMWYKL